MYTMSPKPATIMHFEFIKESPCHAEKMISIFELIDNSSIECYCSIGKVMLRGDTHIQLHEVVCFMPRLMIKPAIRQVTPDDSSKYIVDGATNRARVI